jgi:hypothetical protein
MPSVTISESPTLSVEIVPSTSVVEVVAPSSPGIVIAAGTQGPPGPTRVSADPNNIAKLGSDAFVGVFSEDLEAAITKPFFISIPIGAEEMFIFPVAVEIPVGLVGSIGFAESGPVQNQVMVSISKNGSVFGYVTWEIGETTPDLHSLSTIQFARGDRLNVSPPSTIDPGFANASITLAGFRLNQ